MGETGPWPEGADDGRAVDDGVGGRGAEELRRAVEECEARLAEAAGLAAHVRHEINNPLTGLIGQAQLLLREELTDRARRRVETIAQLAVRIRDTVAELRVVRQPEPSTPDGAGDDKEPPRH